MPHRRAIMSSNADGSSTRVVSWAWGVNGVMIVALLGAMLGALAGCTQPPLRADDPRSQFDQYDLSRNEHEPAHQFDEYGRRRPNLRGRLLDEK